MTDANLILGRIQPDFFLGGTIQLDVEKARDSITRLATEINSSETDAALGIIKVVNANMERAIRSISLERGHDPRDFALLPFGGAGALHACELSNEIGISTVFIPPYPGVLSALGVAIADISKDYSRTVMITPGHQMLEQLETEYNGMESNARSDFKSESLNTANLIFNRYIDIRYVGQSYELLIPFPASNIKDSEELQSLITTDFETAHQQRFGYCDTSQNIEVVNVRLKAILPSTTQIPEANSPKASIDSKPIDKRPIYFQTTSLMTPVYNRQNIQVNQKIKGPALITQFDTSIPVFPGWVAQKDQLNNLILKSI